MDDREQAQGRESRRKLIESLNQKEETLKERESKQQEPHQHGRLTEEELEVQVEIEHQRSRRGFASAG